MCSESLCSKVFIGFGYRKKRMGDSSTFGMIAVIFVAGVCMDSEAIVLLFLNTNTLPLFMFGID